jgi:hypothetical protein
MKKILITILSTLFLTSSVYAGALSVGVSGSLASITAEGKDADKDGATDPSGRTATASDHYLLSTRWTMVLL